MSEISRFDFEGFDHNHVELHEEYGPLVQSWNFIQWLGWTNPSEVFATHLQEGDWVEISAQVNQGKNRGALPHVERWLTKRGVRRLLFRSNHPKAVAYADRVMDLLDLVDEAEKVGINVVEELKRKHQLQLEGMNRRVKQHEYLVNEEATLLDNERRERISDLEGQVAFESAYSRYVEDYVGAYGTTKDMMTKAKFKKERFS